MLLWILAICFILYHLYKKVASTHSHWQDLGVKCWKPVILFGDHFWTSIGRECFAELQQRQYKDFPEERFYGGYQMTKPQLFIRDPELLRQIAVRDFDHFTDHVYGGPPKSLWGRILFHLKGEEWRQMRYTLSPTFTSRKIKYMFELVDECAIRFVTYFEKKTEKVQEIEIKDAFKRYTNDVIATCAFGVECNSLVERENEFYVNGNALSDNSGVSKAIKRALYSFCSQLMQVPIIGLRSVYSTEFFKTLMADTVELRKANKVNRPDMLNLLMELKKSNVDIDKTEASNKDTGFATVEEVNLTYNKRKEITLEDIQGQSLNFFIAGFETSAVLLSFAGYEMAINSGVQTRFKEEIDRTMSKYNGKLTYEALNSMTYLDMIVSEALRKWPPVPATSRACTKPYNIPNGLTQLRLDKGDTIMFPIFAMQRDEKYFPDPEKFDPERFSVENRDKINPYTYIPFGAGPRNCIASRFALVEAKVILVRLLSKFELVPIDKTEIPLTLDKTNPFMGAANGIWVGLKRRIE